MQKAFSPEFFVFKNNKFSDSRDGNNHIIDEAPIKADDIIDRIDKGVSNLI